MDNVFDISGKRILITGGAKGLGLEVATAFATQGARVASIDWEDPQPGAEDTAGIRFFHGDVSAPGIEDVVADAVKWLDGIDVVFANAGIGGGGRDAEGAPVQIEATDFDVWRQVHEVNVEGVARVVAAVAPALRTQKWGKVIVTSSIAGLRGNGIIPVAYQSSKAAITGLVKGLALQFAADNIQVNGIAPGPFATAISGGWLLTETGAAAAARVIPAQRVAQPHEIVGAVQLLATDASSFITGVVLPVDGGATAGVV